MLNAETEEEAKHNHEVWERYTKRKMKARKAKRKLQRNSRKANRKN